MIVAFMEGSNPPTTILEFSKIIEFFLVIQLCVLEMFDSINVVATPPDAVLQSIIDKVSLTLDLISNQLQRRSQQLFMCVLTHQAFSNGFQLTFTPEMALSAHFNFKIVSSRMVTQSLLHISYTNLSNF